MTGGIRRGVVAGVLGAGLALVSCTSAAPTPEVPDPAPPPPPPAACLLDLPRFATATGLTWTPDPSTAGDTRCVYDPGGPVPTGSATPTGSGMPPEFVTVEINDAELTDASDELDAAAALCEPGTSTPVGEGGFVCRFTGGGPTPAVFAAVAREGKLVTVTASGVPDGTTADRLAAAFTEQLA